jgi:TusA-related sulfurtransferase
LKDFCCSCKNCGKSPSFSAAEIWIDADGGMLCEACWRNSIQKNIPVPEQISGSESGFCCFCALCKRTPPDADCKIWIETDKGCICEKCWKETISSILAEKIESSAAQRKGDEPLDIQFGCCQINKKLLNRALDDLKSGASIDIIAENADVVKLMARKYIEVKGCTITAITDINGTCIISVKRP